MHAAKPRMLFVLITVMVGTALALLAYVLQFAPTDVAVLVSLAVAAALLELSPVDINEDVVATTSVAVVFVAIAIGGLPAAVAAGCAMGLASAVAVKTDRTVKTLANTAMHVHASAVAAVVFSAVSGLALWAPASGEAFNAPGRLTLGLLAAGVAYTLVNVLLLSLVVHGAAGVPLARTMHQLGHQVMFLQFLYVGMAAIAYTLWVQAGAVSLLLVAVPLILARRSLHAVQERQEAYDRMVRAFVKAIELKDGYTRGHAERVSDLSVLVAERMGLSYEERQLIRYGAILHDVGKIGVSLGILCKAGPLDDDEFAEMKTHPEVGAEMLRDIDFLKPALAIVHHHHERMDGRGYPGGLKGDEIPLLTRVVTAVDAFDAMTSTRSYRRALPIHVALEELQANAGTQFDVEVVRHLVALVTEEGWEVTDEPVQVAATRHLTSQAVPT